MLRINTQPANQIELADGGHNRSWLPLGLGQASRLDQGLNAQRQHLLPVEDEAFDVVMDLTPRPLQQPVALSTGHPHACRTYVRQAVLGSPARIIP